MVKRYDVEMKETKNGDYVEFSEYETLQGEVEVLKTQIDDLQSENERLKDELQSQ